MLDQAVKQYMKQIISKTVKISREAYSSRYLYRLDSKPGHVLNVETRTHEVEHPRHPADQTNPADAIHPDAIDSYI